MGNILDEPHLVLILKQALLGNPEEDIVTSHVLTLNFEHIMIHLFLGHSGPSENKF